MSFLVTAAGHSGTKFLATQLGKAPGWKVEHEPDTYILPAKVNQRFRNRRYGEVNSWLLKSARHIKTDRKAIILRNPYDVLKSVIRDGDFSECPRVGITYVREAIATLDGLARDGYPIIRFCEMVHNPDYLISVSHLLGMEGLEKCAITTEAINCHDGEGELLQLGNKTKEEFDYFNRQWSCYGCHQTPTSMVRR